MKEKNLYRLADVLAAAATVSLVGLKTGKVSPAVFGWLGAGYFAIMLYQYFSGTVVVTNRYGRIWVKPEDGETPYATSNERIVSADGVKVGDRVYKFCNGTHVTINADDSVSTSSLTGRLVNYMRVVCSPLLPMAAGRSCSMRRL